jgi:hypothetical protein
VPCRQSCKVPYYRQGVLPTGKRMDGCAGLIKGRIPRQLRCRKRDRPRGSSYRGPALSGALAATARIHLAQAGRSMALVPAPARREGAGKDGRCPCRTAFADIRPPPAPQGGSAIDGLPWLFAAATAESRGSPLPQTPLDARCKPYPSLRNSRSNKARPLAPGSRVRPCALVRYRPA